MATLVLQHDVWIICSMASPGVFYRRRQRDHLRPGSTAYPEIDWLHELQPWCGVAEMEQLVWSEEKEIALV